MLVKKLGCKPTISCRISIHNNQTINHFQIGLLIGKIEILLTPNNTPHQNLKKILKKMQEQKKKISIPKIGKTLIKFIHNQISPQKNIVIGNSKNDNKFQTIR